MRSGFLPARVVHVHPTRACNLACVHCYSDSSPAVRDALDVARLAVEGRFGGADARRAMAGHVLAQASVTGRYALNPSVRLEP